MFFDSLHRRDAGLAGLLDEITNSSEEGVWFIAECSDQSVLMFKPFLIFQLDCIEVCVFFPLSTQVVDFEFRLCFGSSAMDVFISLFSFSTSDSAQLFVLIG